MDRINKTPAGEIVMSRQQVRKLDKYATENLKIPGIVLMENAGINCTKVIIQHLKQLKAAKACIICGTGNNGGDGYVIARQLANKGFKAKVVIIGDMSKISGDAKTNLTILENMDFEFINILPGKNNIEKYKDIFQSCDCIIDAVFGTGLKGAVKDKYIPLLNVINAVDRFKIAIDIPSGLDCDTGLPLSAVIKADKTITLAAMKKGFKNPDSKQYTGPVVVKPIGINPELVEIP